MSVVFLPYFNLALQSLNFAVSLFLPRQNETITFSQMLDPIKIIWMYLFSFFIACCVSCSHHEEYILSLLSMCWSAHLCIWRCDNIVLLTFVNEFGSVEARLGLFYTSYNSSTVCHSGTVAQMLVQNILLKCKLFWLSNAGLTPHLLIFLFLYIIGRVPWGYIQFLSDIKMNTLLLCVVMVIKLT